MSISSTAVRPTTKTRIPATAESPASSRIELKTNDVSWTPPARRSQTIAGERRPDAARDVLRQHRGHLGLERDPVGDADPECREDPLPADDEEQVVGGEDRQGGEKEERVDVLEQRDRLVPRVPHRVREEGERGNEEGDLQADEHAPAAKERGKPARHVSESRAKGRQTRIRPSAGTGRTTSFSGRTLAG